MSQSNQCINHENDKFPATEKKEKSDDDIAHQRKDDGAGSTSEARNVSKVLTYDKENSKKEYDESTNAFSEIKVSKGEKETLLEIANRNKQRQERLEQIKDKQSGRADLNQQGGLYIHIIFIMNQPCFFIVKKDVLYLHLNCH